MITININELKTPEQIEEAYREALFHVNQYENAGIGDGAEAWNNFEAVCELKDGPAAPTPPPPPQQHAWLDHEDAEWKQAWMAFPDPVQENNGERLQYMGSAYRDGRWQHSFRHRCDPTTGERKYTWIDASPLWHPAQTKAA